MTERTKKLLRKEGLLQNVREWISDGWGLDGAPSDEQAAAALLHEARTQDVCVAQGESHPEHPADLRRIAWRILDVVPAQPLRDVLGIKR